MPVQWEPEDFKEGASIFMEHMIRIQQKGQATKEDFMLMLADVANAMELAEERKRQREEVEQTYNHSIECNSTGPQVLVFDVSGAASNFQE